MLYDDTFSTARVHARGGFCSGTRLAEQTELTLEQCLQLAEEKGGHFAAHGVSVSDGDEHTTCYAFGGECDRVISHPSFTVYTRNQEALRGPGTYELMYIATDVHGSRVRHTVQVTLEDVSPPTEWEGCPDNQFVEIEAGERDGFVDWTVPNVTADNCLAFGKPPVPVEAEGKKPGRRYVIGVHSVSYPIQDAFGNVAPEECDFTITVKPRAHPVVVTCPDDVTINTVERAGFGVGKWPAPTATQGGEQLPASHISYHGGIRPGLPFPYGTTLVKVLARGKITGDRTGEEEQTDECSFRVTVKDPERPFVDGRGFRCDEQHEAFDSTLVEPYGVCDGTDLTVQFHEGYTEHGRYSVLGTETKLARSCCHDEVGQAFSCSGEAGEFRYCVPGSTSVEAGSGLALVQAPPHPAPPRAPPSDCTKGLCMYDQSLDLVELWAPGAAEGLDLCRQRCESTPTCAFFGYCHESDADCKHFSNLCYLFRDCGAWPEVELADASSRSYEGFDVCRMSESPEARPAL